MATVTWRSFTLGYSAYPIHIKAVVNSVVNKMMPPSSKYLLIKEKALGGGGGIRTHGTLSRTLVFKTSAFDHSAT
ncbi:MAG: hypothetical protein ABJZ79_00535, partial [Parasphingorhabdus sp.]|uniref:hypothetical protein n=1 Tax=Parasphingorhabdus sp. TaxID=2709688 RepID=UPI00329777A5